MRVVYFGTPEFAVPSLERLSAAGHDIVAVYTQPDRPSGRGRQVASPPVKRAAERLGLAVRQPERVRLPEVVSELKETAPDLMAIVGYGQIIPPAILAISPIINVHASLLPKYRGAAPIQWAIANGETRTGVTTMRIDQGLDTGDILLSRETEIRPDETAPELSARLAEMGADLLVETFARYNEIVPKPQDHAAATLAPIIKKEHGHANWQSGARDIANRSRGFLPWPGVFTTFRGQLLHIWKASEAEMAATGAPGQLEPLRRRLCVACGNGTTLELLEVQLEGRKRVSGEAFLNGQRLTENERLGD